MGKLTTTEDAERTIHLAMEQADGVVGVAAKLLGITPAQLAGKLVNNKNLKARWKTGKKDVQPPAAVVAIHREVIPEISDEEAEAIALRKEDTAIRSGLSNMGLSPEESEMALSLQAFQRKHFSSSLNLMSGGITKQFIRIMVEIDKIDERLNSKSLDFPLSLQEESMLRQDRVLLLDMMGKFNEKVSKSALIQAKIWQIKKSAENDKAKEPKGILDLSRPTDV